MRTNEQGREKRLKPGIYDLIDDLNSLDSRVSISYLKKKKMMIME